MPKWVKMFVGLLLLPVCLATAKAVWMVLTRARGADSVWLPMLAGAAAWTVVFLLMPKPMWVYVFGHELTHAVWTWMFGGQVRKFKATSNGGHIVATRSNFLITLAPYFFPFYAVVVVLVFIIGSFIWNWGFAYRPWFHVMLGAAYAFHLTLTWQILQTRQTDVTSQGYIFSAAVIFLGNAAVLVMAVPLLTGHDLLQAFEWWFQCNHQMFHQLARML